MSENNSDNNNNTDNEISVQNTDYGELESDDSIDEDTKNIILNKMKDDDFFMSVAKSKSKKKERKKINLIDLSIKPESNKFISSRVSEKKKDIIAPKKRHFNPRLPPYALK
jgi:hypothetical protein